MPRGFRCSSPASSTSSFRKWAWRWRKCWSERLHVDFPEAQTCCGQPAFNSGYRDEARTVARHFLKSFGTPNTSWCPPAPAPRWSPITLRSCSRRSPKRSRESTLSETQVWEFSSFLTEVAGSGGRRRAPRRRGDLSRQLPRAARARRSRAAPRRLLAQRARAGTARDGRRPRSAAASAARSP